MNALESCSITSPHGKTEECAKFTIDAPSNVFRFSGVTMPEQSYTLSFWVKGDSDLSITGCGAVIHVTTKWARHVINFTANSANLALAFNSVGTYYLFNTQLEIGTLATDWTPAPEDVDSAVDNAAQDASNAQQTAGEVAGRINTAELEISSLKGCIAMLVVDENGQTMMKQTGEGWSFNFGDFQKQMSDLSTGIQDLNEAQEGTKEQLSNLDKMLNDPNTNEYVTIGTYKDQPCISLSESDSDNVARMTNSDVDAPNFNVKNELRHYDFVWKRRANGNLGLMWTEVTE